MGSPGPRSSGTVRPIMMLEEEEEERAAAGCFLHYNARNGNNRWQEEKKEGREDCVGWMDYAIDELHLSRHGRF